MRPELFPLVGWLGNAFFFARFLIHWIRSGREGASRVPAGFWWLSLLGAACLFVYTLWVGEPVLLLGYVVTLSIYLHDLFLERGLPVRSASLRATLGVTVLTWLLLVVAGLARMTNQLVAPTSILLLGLAGQVVWTSRFVEQWVEARRTGQDAFSVRFFWLSLLGSALLLPYVLFRGDPVWIAGLALAPVVALRNLALLGALRPSSWTLRRAARPVPEPQPARRRIRYPAPAALIALCATVPALAVVPSRDLEAHEPHVAPPGGLPLPEPLPRALSFYALGDTGERCQAQADVARAMADLRPLARPSFAVLLGDNFYPHGITSVDDPRWETHFEEPYRGAGLDFPFYASLGNHDYSGDVDAEIEYGRRHDGWRMPDRYYDFHAEANGVDVDVFVLDTHPIRMKRSRADDQVRWLEGRLKESTARWKVVAGHHPMVSNGEHGGSSNLRRELEPLFERYGVNLYLSGHDHDLEVLETTGNWTQVVSGAGSKVRPVTWRRDTLYAESSPGFVWVELGEEALRVHVFTADGGLRYTHLVAGEP